MTGQSGSTADVLAHHVEALVAKDVAACASDYINDPVIVSPDGIIEGCTQGGKCRRVAPVLLRG